MQKYTQFVSKVGRVRVTEDDLRESDAEAGGEEYEATTGDWTGFSKWRKKFSSDELWLVIFPKGGKGLILSYIAWICQLQK